MAQWGRGDARWIVQHREDGKNVNGWHWEEKNVLGQVKERLSELFQQVSVDLGGPAGSLVFTSCKSVEGEAALTTRKGNKRLCIYDLKVTLDWEVTLASSTQVTGTMCVQEFASASDEDDYLFEVTTTPATGADQEAAKKLVESQGKQEVLKRLVGLAQEMAAL